jgi:hypothetical protein
MRDSYSFDDIYESAHVIRYQLAVYYLNAFEQRRKAMQGLVGCTSSPLPPGALAKQK